MGYCVSVDPWIIFFLRKMAAQDSSWRIMCTHLCATNPNQDTHEVEFIDGTSRFSCQEPRRP